LLACSRSQVARVPKILDRMDAMSTKRIVECVGGALALAAAGWAAYLDISSDGKDTTVMRWYGVGLGFALLAWVVGRVIANRGQGSSQ